MGGIIFRTKRAALEMIVLRGTTLEHWSSVLGGEENKREEILHLYSYVRIRGQLKQCLSDLHSSKKELRKMLCLTY